MPESALDKKRKAFLEGDPMPEGGVIADDDATSPPADTGTGTGEPSPDTAPETVRRDDPLAPLMDELDLTAQYGSSDQALRAAAAQRTYIEEQRQDIKGLKQLLQETASKKPVIEPPGATEFVEGLSEHPDETLRKAGYVKAADVQPIIKRVEGLEADYQKQMVVSSLNQHDDLADIADHFHRTGEYPTASKNPTWNAMMAEVDARPGFKQMPIPDAIDALHALVQGGSKPPVSPVSDRKKAGASTASRGRKSTTRSPGTLPDFDKMSHQEIRQWYVDNGMVD